MYNHYGHPHYGHEQEPSQAQAYYPMDMHGHPVPGAPPPWNMQPHPHPGWQHDGAPSWQPPPWHAEPRPWHDPYEGRRGSIPHPQHDTHSTAWGHTRHSPAPQPPSHSQGEPHQRSSRTPGGRAATPGHSQHGDKSHSGRGGRADMGSASRGQQHGDRRRHDASPSRNLGRADRHVPVVLHGSNSPGSRERDRGSLDRNRSRDTGWDKGTGQQRQRGQHGSKPSWWVHPDLSKGFADIECRVKYDELPARLPAFLPGAAATGSKGSSGLHGEDGATAAAAANAAASPPPPPPPDPTQQTSASADIAVGQLHLDGPQVLPQEQPAAAAHGQAAGEASAAGLSPPARTAEGAAHDAGKPESQAQAGTGRLPAAGAEAVAGSPAAAAAAAAAVAAAGDASSRAQLPIILFDLNGTLTSHTFQRRSSGVTQVRPGVALLARTLAHKARIGIFSSATHRTVADARALIEEACEGTPLFEPGLILHREHTQPAPAHHIKAGGKAWDTVKPLGRWFKHLHRVLLVDDDNYKALPTERSNMVVVPCWEEERDCPVLQRLAEAFDQELSGLGPDADLRPVAAAVHARLFASNLLAEGAKETEHGATDDDDTASDNDRGNEEGSGDEEDGPQRKRARLQAPPECGAPPHAQHLITQLFPQQDQEQQQQEQEQQRQQQEQDQQQQQRQQQEQEQQRQQQEQDQQQQQEQQLQQQVGAGTQVAADDEMGFIPVQPYQSWGDPLGVGSQPQQQRQQQQQHEGDTAAGAAPMLVDGPQSLKQGLKQLASLIREHPDSMAALAVAMDAVNAFKPVVSEAQPTLQANKMVVQQGTLIRAYPRCLALMEAVWSVPAPYPKTVVAVLAAFANSKRWKVQWEVPDVPVVPATDPGGAPLDTPAAAAKTSADYVGTCTVSSSKGVVLQVVRQAPFKKTAKAQAAAAAIEQLLQSGVSEAEMLAAVREDGKAAAPASGGAAAPAAAGAGGRGAGSKGAKAQKAKAQKAAAGPASNALAGNLAAGAGPSAMGGGSSGRQAAQQQQGSRQPSRGAQQQRQGLAGTSAAVLPPAAAGLPSSSASLPPAAAGLPSASAGPPHAGLWAGTSRSCMGSGYAFNVTAQGDVAPEADMDEDT